MIPPKSVLDATRRRFEQEDNQRKRDEVVAKIREGKVLEADDPERLVLRTERLLNNPGVIRNLAKSLGEDEDMVSKATLSRIGRERVLLENNLLGFAFLEVGILAGRTVGLVEIHSTEGDGFGTGFLVSPRLLLTNNHVLPDKATAQTSGVRFNYELNRNRRELPDYQFTFTPDEFYLTDEELDFTLVAVGTISDDGEEVPLSCFGFNKLSREQGKIILGEPINIIQHPNGRRKELALQENKLVNRLPLFLHYETDTEPGSSGSPLFNKVWEVIGLHHSGVPKTNKRDQILTRDNQIYDSRTMSEDRIQWIANEGVRISEIIRHLEEVRPNLQESQRQLLDEMLNPPVTTFPPIVVPPFVKTSVVTPPDDEDKPVSRGGSTSDSAPPRRRESGTSATVSSSGGSAVSITIPLQITMRLGSPASAAVVSAEPVAEAEEPEGLREALREFHEARRKPYFDAAKDKTDRDSYYVGINWNAGPDALYDALSKLVQDTHTRKFKYAPPRELYPWVDLQPDLKIKSIYTGHVFDPPQLIADELRMEEQAFRELRRLERMESTLSAKELQERRNRVEQALKFNCEHVVPQSWFDKDEPMRGDLHHLFACEEKCNSFRSNTPYFDFPDFEEKVIQGCGKSEAGKFEPSGGKGAVARATLYFLLRYPREIGDAQREMQAERLPTLIAWSTQFPVTDYERHRNQAIFEKQGNRNPLIDFPELVGKVNFVRGLG